MYQTVYLDNAATTFPKPEVVYETMDNVYRRYGVNSGRSSYKLAREANKVINDARTKLGKLINFNNYNRIIFSPSATIAMNQIINGLQWEEGKTVYVTPFEHNAIMRPLNYIRKRYNIKIEIIPFNLTTFELDIEELKLMFLKNYPDYIFMSHVSNVTGFIIPINEIIEISRKYEPIIVLDCAQSMGLLPMNIEELNIDYVVFAGHKTLYSPFGIAGFIDKSKVTLNNFILGGTGSDSLNLDMPENYPGNYEAGSQNIQAISGLNAAINWIDEIGIEIIREKEKILAKRLIDGLQDVYGTKLYLPSNLNNHVGIISCTFNDYMPEDIGHILDEEFNIAVRTGYHCAPLVHDFLGTREKGGTVRLSLGYFNEKEDIDYLLTCLKDI